jgi:hypothetical protein
VIVTLAAQRLRAAVGAWRSYAGSSGLDRIFQCLQMLESGSINDWPILATRSPGQRST